MQHNSIVLEQTLEGLDNRRMHLDNSHKDMIMQEQDYEILQTLMYTHYTYK